ncbi:MAG: NAD-dependent epimerase/dehydratase family protein [Caldilineaceae bacterium]|nr:NAD-dependent epimerase/dehydratase family protein [Caldilineaceae bacterium]
MKVLVTGGSGFTGSHLCRRLVSEGYDVRALVRNAAQAAGLQQQGIETVYGDLRDRESLRRAVDGVDQVYHIAALFRPENVTRQDMWAINVQGTQNLLDAAEAVGVARFVHCSTSGVHGDIEKPPATEQSPYNPGDYYQESKVAGEQLAMRYIDEGRLPITIFRPSGIYGPGDLRFLKLIKSIKRGRFAMIGSGEAMYHLIYIDDLIDGILLCGAKDAALGQVYLLAGCEPKTVNGLVQTVADVMQAPRPWLKVPFAPVYAASYACEAICKPLGIHPPLYRRRVGFFKHMRWFDTSKAQRELGFNPKIDVRCGIERTARWYQQEGLL